MSDVERQAVRLEYQLQIQFIFEKNRRFFCGQKNLIQNKTSKFGFKIKNIDNKVTPEARIKNLNLKSCEGTTIQNTFDEEYSIPKLNPEQEIILWWSDTLAPIMNGQAWIQFDIVSLDGQSDFSTFKIDIESKKRYKYPTKNKWGKGLIIRGELEQLQAVTNLYILVLTFLVFLDGVWGLGSIVNDMVKLFGWLLHTTGSILVIISNNI